MSESMLVLVAGPFRSGTEDDPAKMEANLGKLEAAALEVWKRGHVPVIGEWLALPLARQDGSQKIGDAAWEALGYPVADRLIDRCDAVLRLPGPSRGADGDVARARSRGLPILFSVEDLPQVDPAPSRRG